MKLWTKNVDMMILAALITSMIAASVGLHLPVPLPIDMILSLGGFVGLSITVLYFAAGVFVQMRKQRELDR